MAMIERSLISPCSTWLAPPIASHYLPPPPSASSSSYHPNHLSTPLFACPAPLHCHRQPTAPCLSSPLPPLQTASLLPLPPPPPTTSSFSRRLLLLSPPPPPPIASSSSPSPLQSWSLTPLHHLCRLPPPLHTLPPLPLRTVSHPRSRPLGPAPQPLETLKLHAPAAPPSIALDPHLSTSTPCITTLKLAFGTSPHRLSIASATSHRLCRAPPASPPVAHGLVVIAMILFILLSPGLLFQMPGRFRAV